MASSQAPPYLDCLLARAEIPDEACSGTLTDIFDSGPGPAFVRVLPGNGEHRPVRCYEGEPDF